MVRSRFPVFACLALVVAMLAGPAAALSRQASPAPSTEGLSLAASGLENPRGFDWGPDGSLYIAEASTTVGAGPDATPVTSGLTAGLDGDIVKVTTGSCPVVFQGNLPSSGGQGGPDLGPASIVILNGQVYLLDEGGGAAHGNPLTPDGIYLIPGDGSAKVVTDLGAWVSANPVANPPADSDGDLTAMVLAGEGFLVLESDGGQVIQVGSDGSITRLVDLSSFDARPSGLVMTPGSGQVLVGLGDRVVSIGDSGVVSDAWTGLESVVDIAAGPDGALYAVQVDGSVVRRVAPDASKQIAVGFEDPAAIELGPDGALYVSSPSSGGMAGHGSVVRIDLNYGQVATMSDEVLSGSTCLPTPTATSAPVTPATGTPDGGATSTPDSGATGTPETGSTVTIDNFAFSPGSITVSAGTTVTWVNNDTAAHTVTADDGSFDSGNLAPGDSFTHTFTSAGSFSYHCNYHPNMVATVVVN